MKFDQQWINENLEIVKDKYVTLSETFSKFRRANPDHDEPVAEREIFKSLETSLSRLGTFRAGKVFDLSQLLIGWNYDEIDVNDLDESDMTRFMREIAVAVDDLDDAIDYFTYEPLTEVVATKRVSASGGALKISLTSECNAMGIGVGDYVRVTVSKVSGHR